MSKHWMGVWRMACIFSVSCAIHCFMKTMCLIVVCQSTITPPSCQCRSSGPHCATCLPGKRRKSLSAGEIVCSCLYQGLRASQHWQDLLTSHDTSHVVPARAYRKKMYVESVSRDLLDTSVLRWGPRCVSLQALCYLAHACHQTVASALPHGGSTHHRHASQAQVCAGEGP